VSFYVVGLVYAYRTFWLDPGPNWDEVKVAEFLEIGARGTARGGWHLGHARNSSTSASRNTRSLRGGAPIVG
jgi:hypothetical protein